MAETKKDEFDPEENSFDHQSNEPPAIEDEEKVLTLPHTLKLEHPFNLGDTEYVELEFKERLNAGHRAHLPIDMGQIKQGHYFPMIRGMAGIPTEAVLKISSPDLTKAIEVVNHFL